jgi:hypothetical protein
LGGGLEYQFNTESGRLFGRQCARVETQSAIFVDQVGDGSESYCGMRFQHSLVCDGGPSGRLTASRFAEALDEVDYVLPLGDE